MPSQMASCAGPRPSQIPRPTSNDRPMSALSGHRVASASNVTFRSRSSSATSILAHSGLPRPSSSMAVYSAVPRRSGSRASQTGIPRPASSMAAHSRSSHPHLSTTKSSHTRMPPNSVCPRVTDIIQYVSVRSFQYNHGVNDADDIANRTPSIWKVYGPP